MILIRQHRHATGGYLWELPAGKLDDGESPESCASREMEEEIGVRAEEFRHLTTIWTTPRSRLTSSLSGTKCRFRKLLSGFGAARSTMRRR